MPLLSLIFGLLLALLAVLPSPYWIIAPGSAVDLRSRVSLAGYAASPNRYFLTDVYVQHISWLLLPMRYLPGVRMVRQDEVIPKGVQPKAYDRILVQAMDDSQDIAGLVAERAAGLRVQDPLTQVYVMGILPASRAKGILSAGDILLAAAGHPVMASRDLIKSVERLSPGTRVPIVFQHAGHVEHAQIATIRTPSGARLGILVQAHTQKPSLPVPVKISLENISGSSGGLMLALQIYNTLRPDPSHANRLIAGTGTLAYDGAVGPIEGAQQKLLAARRAGVAIFLVPRSNYADIAKETGVRIIPVDSFKEALQALKS